MIYSVQQNPKHEIDKRIAFLEQIKGYDPSWVSIIFEPSDLIDPDGPVALSNLPINTYQMKLVNVVKYVDGEQLYPLPVNTETSEKVEVVAQAGKVD